MGEWDIKQDFGLSDEELASYDFWTSLGSALTYVGISADKIMGGDIFDNNLMRDALLDDAMKRAVNELFLNNEALLNLSISDSLHPYRKGTNK